MCLKLLKRDFLSTQVISSRLPLDLFGDFFAYCSTWSVTFLLTSRLVGDFFAYYLTWLATYLLTAQLGWLLSLLTVHLSWLVFRLSSRTQVNKRIKESSARK